MNRLTVTLLALTFSNCVTVPKGEIEDLKPAVRAVHQSFRWKDFRGAAEMMVAERQEAFIKARTKLKDDKDLFITNFELEDAKLSPDMLVAKAVTRISWYRLPSTNEQTATVTSVFVWRDGIWQLESQDDGPFEDLKPAPKKKPAPVQPELAADAG
ncbi:MAG: hypothetical protein Q8K32_18450 [Archangium sp.]|nr:hypothetical protein [Archangium sp.]